MMPLTDPSEMPETPVTIETPLEPETPEVIVWDEPPEPLEQQDDTQH